jgi:hypothetical protein
MNAREGKDDIACNAMVRATLLALADLSPGPLLSLLVVLIDQIRSPIETQNRRNKQTYDTYTFTIDIGPLVLEIYCSTEHIHKYGGVIVKKAQTKKM